MHDSDQSVDFSEQENDNDETFLDIVDYQDDDDWGIPVSVQEDLDLTNPAHVKLHQMRSCVKTTVQKHMPFTKNEKRIIALMLMLRKKGAPLDAVDEVMNWHLKETGAMKDWMRPSDCHDYVSRKVMLKKLKVRCGLTEQVFMKTRIKLPSAGANVDIIHFDARDRVVQLLTDPRFDDDDFLHFKNDPLAHPTIEDLDYIADINTGKSYIETHREKITKPNQMLVPIICYQDSTVTGQFDKLPVEPFKITLGIFSRKARDRPEAWRTLGFIPASPHKDLSKAEQCFLNAGHMAVRKMQGFHNPEEDVSSVEGVSVDADDWEKEFEVCKKKPQDLHRILATLLGSLKELCETGMRWDYKHGGQLHKGLELVFYIAFIKCDTEEGDKLCGRYTGRGHNVKSICRYCTIATDQLDCVKFPPGAKMKKPSMIGPLCKLAQEGSENALAKLQSISQHPIKNVFYDLPFGSHNDRGVHGSTPMEMLHQILLGTFPMVRAQFLEQIGEHSQAHYHINDIARLLGRFMARQSERDLPKTSFSKGIFASKLTGKEYTGVLLLIAAVLQCTNGRALLREKGKRKHFGEEHLIDDWVLLVELLLEWEAHLKLPQMETKHVKRLKKKHEFLMALLKKIANRTEGMGMKVMKFHGIVHLYQDIMDFGVPLNVDAAPCEQHHHPVKQASVLTQKDAMLFEEQIATRGEELHLLELADAEINHHLGRWEHFLVDQKRGLDKTEQDPVITNAPLTCGAQIKVHDGDSGAAMEFCNNKAAWIEWDPRLAEFLLNLQRRMEAFGLSGLDVRTEHRRGKLIFRGHPNYRRRGAWHDWAMIDWGFHGESPAEIACFVDLSRAAQEFQLHFAGCIVQKGVYAVVESAEWEPRPDANTLGVSELFRPLKKEVTWLDNNEVPSWKPKHYLAPVDSISAPMAVIPDIGPSPNRCFRVLPRSKWAELFATWLDAPHQDDVNEMMSWEESEDS